MKDLLWFFDLQEKCQTFDDLLNTTGWEPEYARKVHNTAHEIVKRITNFDELTALWDVRRDMEFLSEMMEGLQREVRNLPRDRFTDQHKHSRDAALRVQRQLADMRSSFENVLSRVRDREAILKLYEAFFKVVSRIDPVVAIRIRDELTDQIPELVAFIPQTVTTVA